MHLQMDGCLAGIGIRPETGEAFFQLSLIGKEYQALFFLMLKTSKLRKLYSFR